MSIDSLLAELNARQRLAACIPRQHALVLAGAGTGKTKTIVARAAYLISSGIPPHRIQIMAFTRRAAAEIVERVKMHLGDAAFGLNASTFHAWCMHLIHRAPQAFGCKGYSVIDDDDQLMLFKVLRGTKKSGDLPNASQIHHLYSLARNTLKSLDATLQEHASDAYKHKDAIGKIMLGYEAKKRERRYLDYDDILDVVARRLETSLETRSWLANLYDHLLVDEMQDTNPLQWKLINPLREHVTLYCVGDDAQSIYGFRGADFRNVHSFSSRVENSVILKLEDNYRSTQEILDISNWLLSRSLLNYEKNLSGVRGAGKQPHLHTFSNEWEEANWITEDILKRHSEGTEWRNHMILVRSSYAARALQAPLLAKNIPYIFIGGVKLLESAHVRDLLSVLRLVANPKDEIGWMRFLTLWKGVGEVTATDLIEHLMLAEDLGECIKIISDEPKLPKAAINTVAIVKQFQNDVAKAITKAFEALEELLAEKYKNRDWDKRRGDFSIVEKLAEKHSSILEFIEEYVLDPVYETERTRTDDSDVVTVITIHSAKGTEREVCYVLNVSPQAYPTSYAIGNADKVEEERRVLYVALTRAKDELIVTRHAPTGSDGFSLWARSDHSPEEDGPETYFFNSLPEGLFEEHLHQVQSPPTLSAAPDAKEGFHVGIKIDDESQNLTTAEAVLDTGVRRLPKLYQMNSVAEAIKKLREAGSPGPRGVGTADKMLATIPEIEEYAVTNPSSELEHYLGLSWNAYAHWFVRGDKRKPFLQKVVVHFEKAVEMEKAGTSRWITCAGDLGRLLVEEALIRDLERAISLLEAVFSLTKKFEPSLCFYAEAIYQTGDFIRAAKIATELQQRFPGSIPGNIRVIACKAYRAEITRLKNAKMYREAFAVSDKLLQTPGASQADRKDNEELRAMTTNSTL